jgi:hypothetical protein
LASRTAGLPTHRPPSESGAGSRGRLIIQCCADDVPHHRGQGLGVGEFSFGGYFSSRCAAPAPIHGQRLQPLQIQMPVELTTKSSRLRNCAWVPFIGMIARTVIGA